MISIRKLAPKHLTRAIVALAARSVNKQSGNKLMVTRDDRASNADQNKEFGHPLENHGTRVQLNKRTTITVETERLLVVQRTGSSQPASLSGLEGARDTRQSLVRRR